MIDKHHRWTTEKKNAGKCLYVQGNKRIFSLKENQPHFSHLNKGTETKKQTLNFEQFFCCHFLIQIQSVEIFPHEAY